MEQSFLKKQKKLEGVSEGNISVREINGATKEQIEKINFFIQREIDWLDSDEYLLRKKKATGMSEEKIKRDIQRIKEQAMKATINILDGDGDSDYAMGIYSSDKKNPVVNIFRLDQKKLKENNIDGEALTLSTLDHEIKHMLSEESLETMDDLVRVITGGNYRKYPKINNKRLIDYLIPGETRGCWASRAQEQQVISKRIMDIMEEQYGIKRGIKLTKEDLQRMITDFNTQIKNRDLRNSDVIEMLFKMKDKHGNKYKDKLCEMVNSAY